jgi:hypothetical protein
MKPDPAFETACAKKSRRHLKQYLEHHTKSDHKHEKMPAKKHRFLAILLLGIYMSAYAESLPKDISDRISPGCRVLSYCSGTARLGLP